MSPLLPDIRKKQSVTLSSIRKVENGTSDTILRSRLYHQRPKLRIRTRSAVHPRLCAPRPGHGTDGRLRYHVEYILKHGQENRASTAGRIAHPAQRSRHSTPPTYCPRTWRDGIISSAQKRWSHEGWIGACRLTDELRNPGWADLVVSALPAHTSKSLPCSTSRLDEEAAGFVRRGVHQRIT